MRSVEWIRDIPSVTRPGSWWLASLLSILLLASCNPVNPDAAVRSTVTTSADTTTTSTAPPITTPVRFGSPDWECLSDNGTLIEIEGALRSSYWRDDIERDTVIDATSAKWDGRDSLGQPIQWSVTLGGDAGACWFGGSWQGAWDDTDPDVTWEDPYHHSGFLTLRLADFLVEGVTVDNQGDGIRMEEDARDFRIRGVYLTDIHDDCIENDYLHGGLLEDSFLDGCYVGLSASRIDGEDVDGSQNIWHIENNLIRMEAQPTPFEGPSPGHGPIFKWSSGGPGVVLRNNLIRVDQPPNHGDLAVPEDLNLVECEDNVVVWGGSGPYPDSFPDCFAVTTDTSIWDEAVADWEAAFGGTS